LVVDFGIVRVPTQHTNIRLRTGTDLAAKDIDAWVPPALYREHTPDVENLI
jgi:hypothetical protein